MSSRITFQLSLATACWLLFMRVVRFFELKSEWIGVIWEMFTIPFLLALPVCLWFSLRNFRKEGYVVGGQSFWSVVLVVLGLVMLLW
ncbi:MAG: hypothetical protein ACKOAR_05985 [Bacteroidota bacterium]